MSRGQWYAWLPAPYSRSRGFDQINEAGLGHPGALPDATAISSGSRGHHLAALVSCLSLC